MQERHTLVICLCAVRVRACACVCVRVRACACVYRGDVPMQERRTLVICLCAVFVVTLAYQLFRGLFLLTFVFVIIVGKDCPISC